MGTKDHPKEDTYNEFLQRNNGSSNAFTAGENTNFYFNVNNTALFETLSIFSGFFTCPLFLESCVNREMKAVDNENSKNLQSDVWRIQHLIGTLTHADHPMNHFCCISSLVSRVATGNEKTLGLPDIRDRAIAFHNTYCTPSCMKLVVLSAHASSAVRSQVETLFRSLKFGSSPRSPISVDSSQRITGRLTCFPRHR